MTTNTRPYCVMNNKTKEIRLIDGKSQSNVLGFVSREYFTVSTPNAKEVARLMSTGVKLELITPIDQQ